MRRGGIAGSYCGFTPSFLRNLHIVFHSSCINLYSHPQCKRVLFSPRPFWQLLFVDIFMMVIMATHMAESEEELKSLLWKVKEENEKVGLKLNTQKTNITISGPITSWQIGKQWKQ